MSRNISVNGIPLDPDDVAIPCGLIAHEFFTGIPFEFIYKIHSNSSIVKKQVYPFRLMGLYGMRIRGSMSIPILISSG